MPLTLCDTVKPIYFCSIFCGLTPFCIKSQYIKTTKWNTLWCLSFLIIFEAIALSALFQRNIKRTGVIFEITDLLQVWLCVFNMAVAIIFSCVYKKMASVINKRHRVRFNTSTVIFQVIKLLRCIVKLDKEFYTPRMREKIIKGYNRARAYSISATLITILASVFLAVTDALTYALAETSHVIEIGYFIAYCIPLFTMNCMLLQFFVLALTLRQRFRWLNEILHEVVVNCGLLKTVSYNCSCFARNKLQRKYAT